MAIIDLSCNDTASIFSQIFCVFTNDVTGSTWLTFLGLFVFLFVLAIGIFRAPVEIALALLIPVAIIGALVTSQFMPVIGALAFYFTFLIVKQIFF